jgi:GDP/UDP-N,N'-diacetylbacillosamine 2-epimerase (hydrolysing)
MEGIRQSPLLELQLIATGMHLSSEFGLTVKMIEEDGFLVNRKIEMLLSSDTAVGITKSMGLGMIGFADAFADIKPDLILLLGDRYELLSAAAAAMIARIPIAHLHGGETTQGAFDEAIRHSITKMSHLHFVAAEEYRRRVIQLGEDPERVFNVGGLGIDNILRLNFLTRHELEKELNFKLRQRNLLITFHPVTLENNTTAKQMDELLAALAKLHDTGLIFTMPNADTGGRIIFEKIQAFCKIKTNARAYTSLGQIRYLSCIQHVDGIVGNSSSGLLEVPSFNKGTINIGDRQHGRLRAASVIDCEPERGKIGIALLRLFSIEFQQQLVNNNNPYGKGGASESVVKILEKKDFKKILKKQFYDLL